MNIVLAISATALIIAGLGVLAAFGMAAVGEFQHEMDSKH